VTAVPVYPVRVEGSLDPGLSRWKWLVKWLLVIPHVVVLAILWVAFVGVSMIALFSIVLTGRYPRTLFDFNVGVLRWSWRVGFYSFSANGTDRYPPFTLADRPDYPATLEIPYPERLSRGLALVKWWLLALPHYCVVALFVGGGIWAVDQAGDWRFGGGLVDLLVLVAVVVLLFTGRYPQSIFDLVLGLNRWVLRVAAYAALMTDAYPPFRLDLGGREERGAVAIGTSATVAPTARARPTGFGRVVAIVAGSILGLVTLGLVAAGGTGIAVDQFNRDGGFVMSPTETYSTATYAIASKPFDLKTGGPDSLVRDIVGDLRIRGESARPIFVGVASATSVDQYLRGVNHAVVVEVGDTSLWGGTGLGKSDRDNDIVPGGPAAAPTEQTFWKASSAGPGERSVRWAPEDGSWRIVVMNADGSAGVNAELGAGAELDPLLWIALGVLGAGLLLGAVSAGLLVAGLRRG